MIAEDGPDADFKSNLDDLGWSYGQAAAQELCDALRLDGIALSTMGLPSPLVVDGCKIDEVSMVLCYQMEPHFFTSIVTDTATRIGVKCTNVTHQELYGTVKSSIVTIRVPLVDYAFNACERCGGTIDVQPQPSRTAYQPDPLNTKNRSVLLCASCAVDHHAYWDDQWAAYNAGRG